MMEDPQATDLSVKTPDTRTDGKTACSSKQDKFDHQNDDCSVEVELKDTHESSFPLDGEERGRKRDAFIEGCQLSCKRGKFEHSEVPDTEEFSQEVPHIPAGNSDTMREKEKETLALMDVQNNEPVECGDHAHRKNEEPMGEEKNVESQKTEMTESENFRSEGNQLEFFQEVPYVPTENSDTMRENEKETLALMDVQSNEPVECGDHAHRKNEEPMGEEKNVESQKTEITESENFGSEEKILGKNEPHSAEEGEFEKTESSEEIQKVAICESELGKDENLEDSAGNIANESVSSSEITKESISQNEATDENIAVSEQSEENEETKTETPDENPDYEKSEPNDDLIKAALKHELAAHWTATSHKPYVLNPVTRNTAEFGHVSRIFSSTCRNLSIQRIERVENPYLLALYLNKKEKLRQKNAHVEEKDLFHGTNSEYVDNICTNNFDWRRCGRSRGHKFGRGVSFAPHAAYAFHYGAANLMILTKVLVSKSRVGDCNTMVPPEAFDTTTNSPETVFVKYEDDDFLPRYVIHYEKFSSPWDSD